MAPTMRLSNIEAIADQNKVDETSSSFLIHVIKVRVRFMSSSVWDLFDSLAKC